MNLRFLSKWLVPKHNTISKEEEDQFKAIYGTAGWRVFIKKLHNRKHEHNQGLLSLWYTAKADLESLQEAAAASVGFVSRMREIDDILDEIDAEMNVVDRKDIISVPKTIEQYL